MKRIGVVGLGIMGHGIADNFLANGYEVIVWNRSPSKADDVVEKGAVRVESPKKVAEKADIVFEVTADDESSRKVWLDSEGILAGAQKDQVLITCATLSVGWILELSSECEKDGKKLLDMPMTGGRRGAVSGQLILLASGDENQLAEVKDVLKAIAKDVKYFGPVSSGTKYKLILNSLQAVHAAGFGEAIKMAREVGLDEKLAGNALSELPGGYTTQLSWSCYQEEPKPINFSIEWLTKDLDYAHKMIKSDYPIMDQAQAKFNYAKELGLGQSDWTIVNKLEDGSSPLR